MLLQLLDTQRPDRDHDELADHHALYKGGDCFRHRLSRFLPKRPAEADEVYKHRVQIAHYLNYCGPIVNFFMATLFSDELELVAEPKAPDWYATEFATNCDGLGMDLHVMLRDRFTRAAVQRRSWVLVDFPSDGGVAPVDRAEWEARKLGDAYLCPLDECEVLDWEVDDRGELEWAIVHSVDKRRRDPAAGRSTVTERWTIWRRDTWERYALTYKEGERPPAEKTDVPLEAAGPVATQGRVPLARIELPEALYVMGLLASPQIEQMRARNALSFALQRTCYATRILHLEEDRDLGAQGSGYGIKLGVDEKVSWDAPPGDAFAPVAEYSAQLKDEIYRVAQQMALGVENNAAAVGRSGDSKAQDHAATVVVVKAFAREVREAAKRILDLVALGRGDQLTWSIGGMDAYAGEDLATAAEAAVTVETLNIPSVTFRREMAKRVALVALPDATPEQRDKITKEIDAGINDEDVEARETQGTKENDDPEEDPGGDGEGSDTTDGETEDAAED